MRVNWIVNLMIMAVLSIATMQTASAKIGVDYGVASDEVVAGKHVFVHNTLQQKRQILAVISQPKQHGDDKVRTNHIAVAFIGAGHKQNWKDRPAWI